VYRVPAASLKALGAAPEGKGAPDVELVTKGEQGGANDKREKLARQSTDLHGSINPSLSTALGKPNGLALSADETKLYLGESTYKNASWFVMERDLASDPWGAPRPFAGGPGPLAVLEGQAIGTWMEG
jgi:hypothetical protein